MFNNRFNSTHKDPLVEAVRQAQQDGEMRRQAEAIVNEAFGVYNRNALVREDLAEYDAAIEEVYADLKEATKKEYDDKDQSEHGVYKGKKKQGYVVHDKKSGTHTAYHSPQGDDDYGQVDDFPSKRKAVKQIKTSYNLGKKHMEEAKKLADKDYDKDGKIESPKDEVWGSRFRAAKMAGKMEEGAVDAGSYEGSKSVTKSAPKEDPSTPKVPYSQLPKTGNRAGAVIDSAKGALKEYHLEEERKRTASVADAFMSGKKANQRTLKTDGQTVTYHGNTIAKHAGDEVHVTTAGHALSPSTRGHVNGILSRLGSPKLSVKKGQLHHGDTPVDHDAWIKVKKPEKATFNEAAYSAKSARAGKDIGKPGKMFAKIAAKAGAKYGSAERGKSVAGAILKRIRAKHMKEENLEELSQFGSAFAAARKGGQSTFNFGGKSYSTAMKGGPSVSSKSSGPQNNPGLGGAVRSGQFATRDTTPIATRSPAQQQAKVDAAAVRANKSAIPNQTISTPNERGTPVQVASKPVEADKAIQPGSLADKIRSGPAIPPSDKNVGVGSASRMVNSINKNPSAVAQVNAANKPDTSSSSGPSLAMPKLAMPKLAMPKLNEEVQIGDYKYKII